MSEKTRGSAGPTRPAAIAACALTLLLAGCGGGSSKSASTSGSSVSAPTALKSSPGKVTRLAGLLGAAGSAGSAQSYVPTGRIVADSGFRPQVDGFDFENYGNDAGPVNLTPANVYDLFGSQVCASGSGSTCTLTIAAQHWMDQVNASMAGGHCMGFSVSALRFFSGDLNPVRFGAPHTFNLPVRGNVKLQSLIAENFAYQDLPAVYNNAVQGTPDQVLNALIGALNAHKETYTLAIIKPNGSGGHAVTPIAVEDKGNGQAAIIVYDNNFPGILRAVQVDTKRDTWHYVGGINPSYTGEVYTGDAQTKSMLLFPTSAGEKTQPCPFCAPKGSGPGATSASFDKLHYIEVAITSPQREHPHLLFTDPQGRETGFVHGRLIAQIPGLQVIQNYSVQNWASAPEPTFHLPTGHPDYKITVDGSKLKKPIVTQIQVNGAGLVFSIQKIHIAPGQKDTMALPTNDLGLDYASTSSYGSSPLFLVAFASSDPFSRSTTGSPVLRVIELEAAAVGYAPGSAVGLSINGKAGAAVIGVPVGQARIAHPRLLLYLRNLPGKGGGLPVKTYFTGNLPLRANQLVRFSYIHPATPTLPVTVITAQGQPVGKFEVPASR